VKNEYYIGGPWRGGNLPFVCAKESDKNIRGDRRECSISFQPSASCRVSGIRKKEKGGEKRKEINLRQR